MMMNTTLAQLRTLKLDGLVSGLEEQMAQPGMAALSFEERIALLVDREVHARNDRKLVRLLKNAHLKYGQAAIEDIDARSGRGIDRREVMSLALGDWVTAGHSVLITGPTGAGKSWLACALAQYACRRGHSALYQRVPRLQEELRIRHGSGTFGKWLIQLAKTDVLVLDDWGMGAIDSTTRSDLLEIIDDRAANRATIITSQLLRSRTRNNCNAMNNIMRSSSVRTPLPSASSGFPSMHNRDVFVSRLGETGGHHVCKVLRISTESG